MAVVDREDPSLVLRYCVQWLGLCAAAGLVLAQGDPGSDSASLAARAEAAYSQGRWADCAALYVQSIQSGDSTPETLYNSSCCLARAGRVDDAFHFLNLAVDHDYAELDHLKRDPDLASLRTDPRWLSLTDRVSEAQETYIRREGLHRELFFMGKADQAARIEDSPDTDWGAIRQADAERLTRVRELMQDGELRHARDFFTAALIAQHGTDSTDYRFAHELALEAVRRDSAFTTAWWLAAASRDRYLQSMGKPQIYGTQFRPGDDGQWTLEPMDTTVVSDEERSRWHVPSLQQARRRVEELNRNPER